MKWIDAHCHVGQGIMNGLDADKLLADMDRLEIEQAVILPWDRAIAVDNEEGNMFTLELAAKYPDRLISFCTVNPWFGYRALEEIDRCVALGTKGLKLHPPYQGFQISDPFVLPIIEKALTYSLPIYIPTGTPVAAMPMQLAYVADLYPEGTFIQGHFGFPDFWIDSIPSVEHRPNIYVDIAYNAISTIEHAVKTLGAERVLFSSDAPYLSLDNEIDKLLSLSITEEERQLIGRDNMKAILEGGRR
ncbi:amidohydrolase family protein [Cohnella silvisoli]|uniref:Amidohydrolase family protein n=1 Tax=Cohnella silvisoli TaxID=2873699 RepID=A0ABV1L5F7_9BACL|nr:amidohydrolase family protein [Cohnella silvisoli]MCD9026243.1 amidohydrolase family protein [Cohnella silvisoli]